MTPIKSRRAREFSSPEAAHTMAKRFPSTSEGVQDVRGGWEELGEGGREGGREREREGGREGRK